MLFRSVIRPDSLMVPLGEVRLGGCEGAVVGVVGLAGGGQMVPAGAVLFCKGGRKRGWLTVPYRGLLIGAEGTVSYGS